MFNMSKVIKIIALVVLIFTVDIAVVQAQTDKTKPRQISVHGDWGVYMYEENGHKVCFMAAAPKKSEGKYKKRGETFAFITNWTEDGAKDVFNILAGYTYKTGSVVSVQIGSKKFKLPTIKGGMAWTNSAEDDKNLAIAVQKGSLMIIRGTSSRGTLTKDTYSLKGSGAAYKALNKACPIG